MEDDLIYGSQWLRIRWLDVIVFGIGIDPEVTIIAFYFGPIGIYLGYTQERFED